MRDPVADTAVEEGLDVGALDAVADARAKRAGFELPGLDPVANGLLVRTDDAGDVGHGQKLVPEDRTV